MRFDFSSFGRLRVFYLLLHVCVRIGGKVGKSKERLPLDRASFFPHPFILRLAVSCGTLCRVGQIGTDYYLIHLLAWLASISA